MIWSAIGDDGLLLGSLVFMRGSENVWERLQNETGWELKNDLSRDQNWSHSSKTQWE